MNWVEFSFGIGSIMLMFAASMRRWSDSVEFLRLIFVRKANRIRFNLSLLLFFYQISRLEMQNEIKL